jgi:hypothetical protein
VSPAKKSVGARVRKNANNNLNKDLEFHAASVQQNAAYNARPEVIAREKEYRRGPIGYPIKVVNDAIRSVRARLRLTFFTHLTHITSSNSVHTHHMSVNYQIIDRGLE